MLSYLLYSFGMNEAVIEANAYLDAQLSKQQKQAAHAPKSTHTPLSEDYVEEYSAFSMFIAQYGRSYATKDEH